MWKAKIFINVVAFILIICFTVIAQELPPIQNFTPSDYNSENQNWEISQSANKIIYVANNKGLLAYNGTQWVLYPSPNETIMRSVKVINDRIYTGCYMEFGYWIENDFGTLDYISISRQSNLNLKEDEEFWNIESVDNLIIFQSRQRIYIYNLTDQSIHFIESEVEITKIFKVDDNIYYYKSGEGIFKIVNGTERLFIDEESIRTDEVIGIYPLNNDLVVVTKKNGFYKINKDKNLFTNISNSDLNNLSIYDICQLQDGRYAVGTISNGLYHLDEQFKTIGHFNKINGLLNNTVLAVFEDVDGNIWTGLDNGISYINIHAPIQFFKDEKGIMGSIYALAIHNGYLYFGTNQGLFRKKVGGDSTFEFIENSQGQVWSLVIIDNTLFCGHHSGTMIVKGNAVSKIPKTQGTWGLKPLDDSNNLIIEGNYDGLYILEKRGEEWGLRNKIDGFDNSSRFFEVLDQQIFVNHEYKGTFILSVDSNFQSVDSLKVDSKLKSANSGIAKFNDEILYASNKGVFKYDRKIQQFVKDSLLSLAYAETEYVSGRFNLEQDNFWIFTKSSLVNISPSNLTELPRIKKYPITLAVRENIIEFENIIDIEESGKYIIGSSSGYLTFDLKNLEVNDFNVFIDNINKGINENHSLPELLVSKAMNGVFSRNDNNIRIKYYTPEFYKYFKTNFQYRLKGIYNDWSEWTSESSVFFENLPAGQYSFEVRSKIGNKYSSNVATYNFTILSAWYGSDIMIATYIIIFFVMIFFIHSSYRAHYKKKHNKIIDENKKELELTKLLNEKEIIRLKNEQLQEEYKLKSKELAASTMSIIKKNELLTQIKEQLSQVKDKTAVLPVIKIINRHLSGNENWEMFRAAFNNADSEFFKKLKDIHPDLSPNELKLCAYLRLNLSSKEIAPLFNISPRSVEIKRYRLRKRLNLETNENLTSYILSL